MLGFITHSSIVLRLFIHCKFLIIILILTLTQLHVYEQMKRMECPLLYGEIGTFLSDFEIIFLHLVFSS